MSEGRGVALAILGIVALIAVVGLVLLFSGKLTGEVTLPAEYGVYGSPAPKTYGGWDNAQLNSPRGAVVNQAGTAGGRASYPYEGNWVTGVPYTPEGIPVSVIGGNEATYRQPTRLTTCPPGLSRLGVRQMQTLSDEDFANCIAGTFGDGSMCCPNAGLNVRA